MNLVPLHSIIHRPHCPGPWGTLCIGPFLSNPAELLSTGLLPPTSTFTFRHSVLFSMLWRDKQELIFKKEIELRLRSEPGRVMPHAAVMLFDL